MEPSAAIAVIENDLRRLANSVLTRKLGGDWLSHVLDEVSLSRLSARRDEEQKRRAPAQVPQSLLAYTHFYELRRIVEKRWEDFSTALGTKREFTVLADKIEDFRNAPAHSRELLPHERALLEGVAGTLRTQVTTYLSTQSADAKHYPLIESIRDGFGNELDPDAQVPGMETRAMIATGLRLQVGDVVAFCGRAWDPHGRDLTWTLRTYPADISQGKEVTHGTEVTFTWTAETQHVGESVGVEISMASSGPYHRHLKYDHRVTFTYSVDPPADYDYDYGYIESE